MNKILKQLTEIANSEDSAICGCNLKIGNYRVKRTPDKILHFYYGSIICEVDICKKVCYLDNCGYSSYKLTTAQLNYLKQYYKNKGCEIIYVR